MEFMEFGPFTFWGCPALQGRERKRESASIAGERERENVSENVRLMTRNQWIDNRWDERKWEGGWERDREKRLFKAEKKMILINLEKNITKIDREKWDEDFWLKKWGKR
jgi:hypothetical protein